MACIGCLSKCASHHPTLILAKKLVRTWTPLRVVSAARTHAQARIKKQAMFGRMKKGHFGGSTPPLPVEESSNAPEPGSSSDDAVGSEDVVGSKRAHHPPEVPKGEAAPAPAATPKLSIPPQHQHHLTQSPFGAGLPPPSAATMVHLPPPKPQASKSALSNLKLQIPDAVMSASGTRVTCCTECGMRAQRTFGEYSRCFVISVSAACLGLRLLLAVPLGLAVGAAVLALQLLLFLALLLLLPLAALFGLLMPAENETRASPMALPSRHVVVLGGGEGLTREIALECVRRGADVTVLAAESDALTATYELMKTISMERQTQVSEPRQQLRCMQVPTTTPYTLPAGERATPAAALLAARALRWADGLLRWDAERARDRRPNRLLRVPPVGALARGARWCECEERDLEHWQRRRSKRPRRRSRCP